jgi:hypothetical protein
MIEIICKTTMRMEWTMRCLDVVEILTLMPVEAQSVWNLVIRRYGNRMTNGGHSPKPPGAVLG